MTNHIVRQYLLLCLINRGGINVIAATYVTFLLSKGLTILEVNLVNMVFFITLFICEIPTGAFADIFGRKASYVLSCFIFTVSMLVYAYSETFLGFAAAEILGAIGATFASGAFDAWLVDSLKHHGDQRSTHRIFARAMQIKHGTGIVMALVGAYLANISLSLPWFVGAGFFFTGGICATIVMKEDYFVREPFSFKGGLQKLSETIKSSFEYGVKNKNIRFVMLLIVGLNLATMAPNMQWQPFFKPWLPSITDFGFLWTGMALSLMLGAWLSPWVLKKVMDEKLALLLTHVLIALGLIASAVISLFPMALLMFYIHEVARGAVDPIKDTYLHDNIPSKERATVISFESIAHHVGGAIGLLLSGLIAHYGSISLSWIFSGTSLLLVIFVLWKRGS